MRTENKKTLNNNIFYSNNDVTSWQTWRITELMSFRFFYGSIFFSALFRNSILDIVAAVEVTAAASNLTIAIDVHLKLVGKRQR